MSSLGPRKPISPLTKRVSAHTDGLIGRKRPCCSHLESLWELSWMTIATTWRAEDWHASVALCWLQAWDHSHALPPPPPSPLNVPPLWPSEKVPVSRTPGFHSRVIRVGFSRSSHTSDLTPVATLSVVIGSVLGLVDPVLVYCDCQKTVWFAFFVSVWQHVQLSEPIRPWDTLACCWDVQGPTKIRVLVSFCPTIGVGSIS